jgi:retinol dehydrogenase-12
MAERQEESIFDALKKNDPTYMADRYQTSKLLEVFFVRALAEKMNTGTHASERVILNMVNPGFCHSSLSRNAKGIQGLTFWLMKVILARSTEVGSRNLVASAAGGSETHGKYVSDCVVKDPSEFVKSEEGQRTQERVYKELIDILEKIEPGIAKNI